MRSTSQSGEADSSVSPDESGSVIFPHAEGWADPSSHGVWVVKNGESVCYRCHEKETATASVIPACTSCHPVFPHPWGKWTDTESPDFHGLTATAEGIQETCGTQCHGTDFAGGLNNTPCYSCHKLVPHVYENPNIAQAFDSETSVWSDYSVHGEYVQENDAVSQGFCSTNCHGTDNTGGLTGISCNSCHDLFPHSSDWANADKHGASAEGNGKELCKACHGDVLSGGSSSASCTQCHSLYPHADNWGNAGQHGAIVMADSTSACATQCHGADLGGGLSGISCTSCHSAYPHAGDWAEAGIHGAPAEGDGKESCKACHGDDFAGGNSSVPCARCHSVYPHTDNWGDPSGHGETVNNNGSSSCATQCHGADLSGGLSGVSCTSCHSLYPHSAGWAEYSGHGVYGFTNSIADCRLCHGTDYRGGDNGSPSCYTCHANYPHLSGWSSADQHGVAAYGTGKTTCATANCHGVNYEGNGSLVPSCFSCHAYPHTDSSWASGAIPTHATTFIEGILSGSTAICTECHGTDYTGNTGVTSCLSCHTNGVTHTSGWSAGTGHGQFYSGSYTALSTDASCPHCHGAAVTFDSTQTQSSLADQSDCYGCHWAYPHTGWSGSSYSWDVDSAASAWVTHALYALYSPLLVDSSGAAPSSRSGSASQAAVENTCGGGTSGNCHYSGTRTPAPRTGTNVCSVLCH